MSSASPDSESAPHRVAAPPRVHTPIITRVSTPRSPSSPSQRYPSIASSTSPPPTGIWMAESSESSRACTPSLENISEATEFVVDELCGLMQHLVRLPMSSASPDPESAPHRVAAPPRLHTPITRVSTPRSSSSPSQRYPSIASSTSPHFQSSLAAGYPPQLRRGPPSPGPATGVWMAESSESSRACTPSLENISECCLVFEWGVEDSRSRSDVSAQARHVMNEHQVFELAEAGIQHKLAIREQVHPESLCVMLMMLCSMLSFRDNC